MPVVGWATSGADLKRKTRRPLKVKSAHGEPGCKRSGLPNLGARPVSLLCLFDYLSIVIVGLDRISGKLRRARSAIEAGQPSRHALKRSLILRQRLSASIDIACIQHLSGDDERPVTGAHAWFEAREHRAGQPFRRRRSAHIADQERQAVTQVDEIALKAVLGPMRHAMMERRDHDSCDSGAKAAGEGAEMLPKYSSPSISITFSEPVKMPSRNTVSAPYTTERLIALSAS